MMHKNSVATAFVARRYNTAETSGQMINTASDEPRDCDVVSVSGCVVFGFLLFKRSRHPSNNSFDTASGSISPLNFSKRDIRRVEVSIRAGALPLCRAGSSVSSVCGAARHGEKNLTATEVVVNGGID